MTNLNELTPLLVTDDEPLNVRPARRRSVWQFVLAGALSLGVLSLSQQRQPPDSAPFNLANVAVSLDETSPPEDTDDVAFLSSMETFKDPSVDPCVDFYEYACGGWLETHEIPSDRPSIDSSFYVVSERNKDTLQRIFDREPPQIGPLYHSCLAMQEVDADAVAFVAQLIENVHHVNSTLALMELAGELDQSLGINTFFSLFVGADPKDPSTNVLQLAQGGLTLPSREYYLQESKVDAFAALYVDYMAKLFAVKGLDHHNESQYAQNVLDIETAFAKVSLPNAALRNPWTTTTMYPFTEIATRYPFLMAYFNGISKHEPFPMRHAIISTPNFFQAQNELLKDASLLPQLKNYVSFHLLDSFGAILGEYFRRASHDFHGTIQGAGALQSREQFCVRLTTTFLGDEVGKYYMEDVFGPSAKAAAQILVAEIEESLKALLLTESWLDKITYDAAVQKLNNVKNYIGGSDEIPSLPFELQADAFFENVKRLMQFNAAGVIQAIDKPVDDKAWDMFPSTVNAYYDPSANKMVFPAAILQPPFYSAERFPAAANFARIGMVMGHELSHGFDDQGRNYDANGALRSWWTPSVSAEFADKAQCLAAQYSTFPVVSSEDGQVLGTVNGNLTLGENIADNGGVHLAYEAYHLWKSTFAPSPRSPSEEIPTGTSAPDVPIPPVPKPTETGPGKQIHVVTLPPPVLPVPEAENPEPVQTEPSGEIPVATPVAPLVVPEPEPADIGSGQEVPHATPPAPELPVSEAPVVTPPPVPTPIVPVVDTPPVAPDVPDTPAPPNVPDIPAPPVRTPPHKSHKFSDKHGDKKEEREEHEKKHDYEKREDKDDEDKLTRQYGSGSNSVDSKKHNKHNDESKEKDGAEGQRENQKRRHEDEDSDRDDLEGKHRRGRHTNEDDWHGERKSKHERREEESDRHDDKRHGHKEEEEEEEDGRHGKHNRRWDEENDEHKHHKHERKEQRREEQKEREEAKKHDGEFEEKHHREDEDEGDNDDHESKYHEKHRRHEEEREERREECGECGREKHERHHNYETDWDKKQERDGYGNHEDGSGKTRHHWELMESKYPFSGGDARIHTMIEKLARAIAKPRDPVADDRLFFTAFAQNWCEKHTPAYAELLRTIDPHSPGKWRVNGPLMNYHKFSEVFSCPIGTPMNPENKCVIW